jgi:hypothetical protein
VFLPVGLPVAGRATRVAHDKTTAHTHTPLPTDDAGNLFSNSETNNYCQAFEILGDGGAGGTLYFNPSSANGF